MSLDEDVCNSEPNIAYHRAEGALTTECQRRTYGTLVFRCPDPDRFMGVVRATDGPRAPHHRSGGASAALPEPTARQRRPQWSRPSSFWYTNTLITERHGHRFWNHKSAPQAHFSSARKNNLKIIFAPKAHLHSSATDGPRVP